MVLDTGRDPSFIAKSVVLKYTTDPVIHSIGAEEI